MKTKNYFRVLLLALCAIMLGGLMTGCKDQNGPETPTPETPQGPGKAAFARAEATATVSEDMLKVMDITVLYYNNDGELKEAALTTPELKLDTKAPLPTKAGMRLRLAIKDGIDIDSYELVDLTTSMKFRCAAVDANDLIVGPEHKLDGGDSTFKKKGSNVPAWVESFNNHPEMCGFLYEFDADGNSKSIEW